MPAAAWLLGLLGVALFALTIPMTRLASGDAAAPQLPPALVAVGRAALAGLLAAAWLRATGAPRPSAAQWRGLASTAAGVVFGFPLCLGLAVREVPAAHAAVVTGLLPLATAVIAALRGRRAGGPAATRPGAAFWACAGLGAALVLAYALLRGGAQLHAADGLLLAAVALGGWGYVAGARLSAGPQAMPPQQVISWLLVGCLPLTLPLTALLAAQAGAVRPFGSIAGSAWLGFVYVALVSMWLGFFAWYRALQLGGVMAISQVQLLQPFLSMLLAVPLLGEPLDGLAVVGALAVSATVGVARRLAPAPPPATAPPSLPPSATASGAAATRPLRAATRAPAGGVGAAASASRPLR